MCKVASQAKQARLAELIFDRWQRAGYSRHREQPKKDTETRKKVVYGKMIR